LQLPDGNAKSASPHLIEATAAKPVKTRINDGGTGVTGGGVPTFRFTATEIDPTVVVTVIVPEKLPGVRLAGLTVVVTTPVVKVDAA
jgi:hypothetical protein